MADTLVGSGFDEKIDTRINPTGQAEYFAKANNIGFENAAQLTNFVQAQYGRSDVDVTNIFDVLKQGIAPVKVDLPQQIPAKTLDKPTSVLDTNSLLAQNNQIAQQYAQSFNLTPQEIQAGQDVNASKAALRNFDTSLMGGISQIRNKPIALEFQQGQESALTRDAAFTRSSLSNELSAQTDALTALQSQRVAQQQALAAQMQNGQFNLSTAIQLQQIQRTEQQQALAYRTSYGISTPFFNAGGTIYDANNNPISTPEEFFAKAGVESFDEAREKGLLSDASSMTVAERLTQSNADRAYQLDLQQLDSTKFQAITNPVTGEQTVFDPKTGKFTSAPGSIPSDPSQLPFFGLAPKVYDKAAAIATQFDSEAIVKNFNVINEAKQFIDSLPADTKSASDDQGLIYSFAKAMDPNSVVREGEYATVQKYAQSWLENFGFNASRVVNNGEFLTPEARANMKATITQKHDASLKNYQNVQSEYSRRIDQATGKPGIGQQMLTDYSKAFTSDLDSLWDSTFNGSPSMAGKASPVDINKALGSGGLTLSGGANKTSLKVNAPGANTALLTAATTKFPAGNTGGQCGIFVRNIAATFGLDYPKLGDSLTEKMNAVKKYGTSMSNAGVGSVIVTKENPTYGHVAWIIGKNDKGYVVAESNFKQDKKISYGRVIPYNSSKIVGVINPGLKTKTA